MKIQKSNYYPQNQKLNSLYFEALPQKYKNVDKYLIRGPHPNIRDIFMLKKEGVNIIFDFRHTGLRGFKWLEAFVCKIAGIKYIKKPYSFLEQKFPTLSDYETIAKTVKENGELGGKTLFHCNSGKHRTALMTAFYNITKGKPLEKCKKENKDFKPTVEYVVNKHLINARYFSRSKIITKSKNPYKRLRNDFNNKVVESSQRAYDLFINMMK